MERKFLEELGLEKDAIGKILDQNMTEIGVYVTRLKNKEIEANTLRDDLTTANNKITDLEKVNVKQLQDDLAAEKVGRAKDKQRWNLQTALQGAGCKDPDYVIWKLGDTVEFADDNSLKDADGLIEAAKETYASQFQTASSGGTGGIGNFQRGHGDPPSKKSELEKVANDTTLPLVQRVSAREKLFNFKED